MKNKNEFGYNVNIESFCDDSYQSEERYGDWHSSYHNTLKDVTKIDEKDAYPDVTSIHDFKVGDIAYLVWVEWSTGDSFGHASRSQTEAIALLKEGKDAFKLAELIRNPPKKKKDVSQSITFKDSTGQVVDIRYFPWCGYFETLENVNVEAVQIGMFKRKL